MGRRPRSESDTIRYYYWTPHAFYYQEERTGTVWATGLGYSTWHVLRECGKNMTIADLERNINRAGELKEIAKEDCQYLDKPYDLYKHPDD